MLLVVCDSLSNLVDEEDWLIVAVQDVNEEKKKMNDYAMNC